SPFVGAGRLTRRTRSRGEAVSGNARLTHDWNTNPTIVGCRACTAPRLRHLRALRVTPGALPPGPRLHRREPLQRDTRRVHGGVAVARELHRGDPFEADLA